MSVINMLKIFTKYLRSILLSIFIVYVILVGTAQAYFWSDLWPEAYAGVSLVIDGVDGTELIRTTDCVTIGQRYPVQGNFTYDLVGFTQAGNILTYTLATASPRKLAVVGKVSAKGDAPGTTLHYSILHNGAEIFPSSVTGAYLKTAGEALSLGGFAFLINVEQGDTMEVRTWSGTANEQVVSTHLNYFIYPIGRQDN